MVHDAAVLVGLHAVIDIETASVVALERVCGAVVVTRVGRVLVSVLHVVGDHRIGYLLAVVVHDLKLEKKLNLNLKY